MLRRVLSVLRRQPALGRSVLAGTAALGLALACLNPQNDDLPSNGDRATGSESGPTAGVDNAGNSPPATNAPQTPNPGIVAPGPEDSPPEPLAPPEEDPAPTPGDGAVEPDAGPDAGADPNVAP